MVPTSMTATDAKELERIRRKFVALCCNRFLSADSNGYSYGNALQVLNLRTLHERRHPVGALFVISGLLGSKSCPFAMDFVGIRVPTWNLRDFP
jgi:hypothetical protein